MGEVQEAKKLTQQWLQVMPYEIRVWGFLRCRALYAGCEQGVPQGEYALAQCKRCGAWAGDIRHHKAATCPDTYLPPPLYKLHQRTQLLRSLRLL